MNQRPAPLQVSAAAAAAVLAPLQEHIGALLDELDNRDLATVVRTGDRRAPHLMAAYEQNLPDDVWDKPAYNRFESLWRVLLPYQSTADRRTGEAALIFPWMAAVVEDICANGSETRSPRRRSEAVTRRRFQAAIPLAARVSPNGLRARAEMVGPKLNDGGSCANQLRDAASRIEQLEAFAAYIHDLDRLPAASLAIATLDQFFAQARAKLAALSIKGSNSDQEAA